MHTDVVHILGAGGHAKVVIDALLLIGHSPQALRVHDDRQELHGSRILGCLVEAPILPLNGLSGFVHAAVGASTLRQRLLNQSKLCNQKWLTIIHPHACVAASASVDSAVFVAAHAIVGPCAKLQLGVIVNHGAIVDHDCFIGDFSHIAPSASLAGGVRIGAKVLIGAGVRVMPGVCIGDDVTIGAGAVVLTDVPSGQRWVGIPARPMTKDKR